MYGTRDSRSCRSLGDIIPTGLRTGTDCHARVRSGSADSHARGLAQRTWTLYANYAPVCSSGYTSADPPRSWTCTNIPSGYLSLSASKPQWEYAEVGIRW